MKCADCGRVLEVGDQYIQFTASEWAETEGLTAMPEMDDLIGQLMGSSEPSGKIVYCEDCTVDGGVWRFDTVYGDEDEAPALDETQQPTEEDAS